MARTPAFITHDPKREAQIQSRLLDALEARFRRRIAKVLSKEAAGLLARYRELGFVPPPDNDDERAVRDVYMEIGLRSARVFGARVIGDGKARGHVLEVKFSFADFFRGVATGWINQEAERRRITSVTETVRAQIVRQVEKGQAEGLGTDAIARLIRKRIPAYSLTNAARIARTETHGAANYAMHETAKQTGLTLVKEWVAAEDKRTRTEHINANGQTKAMDEPFIVGGEPLMYPGDSSGRAWNTINCRCAVIHRLADPDF
jgi:hypothetical protein